MTDFVVTDDEAAVLFASEVIPDAPPASRRAAKKPSWRWGWKFVLGLAFLFAVFALPGTGGALGIWLVGMFFYFLPWLNSLTRNHKNSGAILILNLFLGWTVLGWIAAVVWSGTNNTRRA